MHHKWTIDGVKSRQRLRCQNYSVVCFMRAAAAADTAAAIQRRIADQVWGATEAAYGHSETTVAALEHEIANQL